MTRLINQKDQLELENRRLNDQLMELKSKAPKPATEGNKD